MDFFYVQHSRGRGGWLLLATLVVFLGVLVVRAVHVERRQAYWDRKVAELCKHEAGIKVFQAVQLSADEFKSLLDRHMKIAVPHERFAPPSAQYVYTTETEYLVRDGLEVGKHITRILQRPERKVLSERINFFRIGGDALPFGHPSHISCPEQTDDLFAETFTKKGGKR